MHFFTMFVICNVHFEKKTFERLQLLMMFKDNYTVYTFQLKSFKRKNLILFQVLFRKMEN